MKNLDRLMNKVKVKADQRRLKLSVSWIEFDTERNVFTLACQLWNGKTGFEKRTDNINSEHQTLKEAYAEYERLYSLYGGKHSQLYYDDLWQ